MLRDRTMERRNFLKSTAPLLATAPALAAGASAAPAATKDHPVAPLVEDLNPVIQGYRDTALALLKPSDKDLQHGLELHANSIVVDGYGFSPGSAMDGAAMKAAIKAGASDIELDDMREDMHMTRCVTSAEEQVEYKSAWRASGVTCNFQNSGQESQDPMVLMKRLAHYTFVTDHLSDFVSKVLTAEDVEAVKAAGHHSLCFTGNGVPITQQWVSISDELRYMEIFRQLGIQMMHLTYNRRNMIGDGCAEPANGGLSDFGEAVVAEMNRIGIIPDCAHSGWQTSLEAAKISAKPVVASHTTAGGIFPHIRSKPDEVVRAIADSGGYVGICCISRFLRGNGDINDLLNHIDYIVKKFGADHVAIGTDVGYSSRNRPEQAKILAEVYKGGRPKQREPFRSLWPKDDFKPAKNAPDSVAWTNWPLFTVGLVQRGHSDEDIRKIIGGNVMRVLRASAVTKVAKV